MTQLLRLDMQTTHALLEMRNTETQQNLVNMYGLKTVVLNLKSHGKKSRKQMLTRM